MGTQRRSDVGRVALDILVHLEEIMRRRRSRNHVLVGVDDEGVEDGVHRTGGLERHGGRGSLKICDGVRRRLKL